MIANFLFLKVAAGQPQSFGNNYSKWMLLERVRFTLDGLECNKIGVSYEAYRGQPNFCSSPFWSCLHNQLSDFWEVSILISCHFWLDELILFVAHVKWFLKDKFHPWVLFQMPVMFVSTFPNSCLFELVYSLKLNQIYIVWMEECFKPIYSL